MHCLHAIHWTHQQLCTQCFSTIAIDCARDERIMHFFVNWSPLQALKNTNPYYRMPWVLPTRTAPAIAAHGLVRASNWSPWSLSTRWKLANKGCQFVKESGKTNIFQVAETEAMVFLTNIPQLPESTRNMQISWRVLQVFLSTRKSQIADCAKLRVAQNQNQRNIELLDAKLEGTHDTSSRVCTGVPCLSVGASKLGNASFPQKQRLSYMCHVYSLAQLYFLGRDLLRFPVPKVPSYWYYPIPCATMVHFSWQTFPRASHRRSHPWVLGHRRMQAQHYAAWCNAP